MFRWTKLDGEARVLRRFLPASGKAEQAGDSATLEVLARGGLIAYGFVHLLIGGLAVQIAWGASAKRAPTPPGR